MLSWTARLPQTRVCTWWASVKVQHGEKERTEGEIRNWGPKISGTLWTMFPTYNDSTGLI